MSNADLQSIPGEDPDTWEAREDDPAAASEVDYLDDDLPEDQIPMDQLAAEELGANLDDPSDYAEDDIAGGA